MSNLLRVVSYNIHKGFSHFNQRMVIHDLRERLRALNADIVFLQEVQGSQVGHAQRWAHWPTAPQYEFLADDVWSDYAYGKNAVYDHGHHGNAILSSYPNVRWVSYKEFGSTHGGDERKVVASLAQRFKELKVDAAISGMGFSASHQVSSAWAGARWSLPPTSLA